ncbi:MAG: hypothetical protein ACT4OY_07150 [Alphaproteobacteria bacterium]
MTGTGTIDDFDLDKAVENMQSVRLSKLFKDLRLIINKTSNNSGMTIKEGANPLSVNPDDYNFD